MDLRLDVSLQRLHWPQLRHFLDVKLDVNPGSLAGCRIFSADFGVFLTTAKERFDLNVFADADMPGCTCYSFAFGKILALD